MDVIDMGEYHGAAARLAAIELLAGLAKRIQEGDLQAIGGVMVAWVGGDGRVDYCYSDTIGYDSVLAMVGPVQADASLRLWGGSDE